MILKLIKRYFKLFDIKDIEWAFHATGNAKDRDDFEYKFKQALTQLADKLNKDQQIIPDWKNGENNMSKVTRSIVEYEDGTLGVLIEVDGKEYCRLYSTFVPKTKADIKFFGSYVIGSTAAISPEDNEPLGKDHDKTPF